MTEGQRPLPQIGERVRFTGGDRFPGTFWEGQIVDIRPATQTVLVPDVLTANPYTDPPFYREVPVYPPGTRLAYVAVLGWPELHVLDLDRAGFKAKRDGVWRSQ